MIFDHTYFGDTLGEDVEKDEDGCNNTKGHTTSVEHSNTPEGRRDHNEGR